MYEISLDAEEGMPNDSSAISSPSAMALSAILRLSTSFLDMLRRPRKSSTVGLTACFYNKQQQIIQLPNLYLRMTGAKKTKNCTIGYTVKKSYFYGNILRKVCKQICDKSVIYL